MKLRKVTILFADEDFDSEFTDSLASALADLECPFDILEQTEAVVSGRDSDFLNYTEVNAAVDDSIEDAARNEELFREMTFTQHCRNDG